MVGFVVLKRLNNRRELYKDIEFVLLFYVHRLFFDRHYIQIQSVQGEEYVDKGESVESALKICETGCDCEGREMLCCLL